MKSVRVSLMVLTALMYVGTLLIFAEHVCNSGAAKRRSTAQTETVETR